MKRISTRQIKPKEIKKKKAPEPKPIDELPKWAAMSISKKRV